nr:hypothetical protein [Tanacetum cinerariifolium]
MKKGDIWFSVVNELVWCFVKSMTYLAYSTGAAKPKKAWKWKKPASASKKESFLTADDNIIFDDPDAALELANSISRTEAEEQETSRLVHETHEHQESDNDSWGESKDDNDDCQSDDERTESNDDKSIDPNKTNDEEEIQEDEFLHRPDDYVPTDDETHDVDDEEYDRINEEMYDDVNVELKDVELADEGKGDEEKTNAKKVNAEHEEANQEKEKTDVPPSSPSRSVSSNYVLDSETLSAIHLRVYNLEKKSNVGIKSLLDTVGITADQVYVNIALMKLVLLMNFKKIF